MSMKQAVDHVKNKKVRYLEKMMVNESLKKIKIWLK